MDIYIASLWKSLYNVLSTVSFIINTGMLLLLAPQLFFEHLYTYAHLHRAYCRCKQYFCLLPIYCYYYYGTVRESLYRIDSSSPYLIVIYNIIICEYIFILWFITSHVYDYFFKALFSSNTQLYFYYNNRNFLLSPHNKYISLT